MNTYPQVCPQFCGYLTLDGPTDAPANVGHHAAKIRHKTRNGTDYEQLNSATSPATGGFTQEDKHQIFLVSAKLITRAGV
jgi:hypothetical protein